VVLACFLVAVHAWTYGFYGLSAYVAAFQRERGWSSAMTSGATAAFYLVGALVLARAPGLVQRWGPRAVLLGGCMALSLGATIAANATAPWQLVAGFLVLAVGWGCTSVPAISTIVALWFDARRGMAMSLALNGASAAGFTLAPALVWLSDRHGIAWAGTTLGLGMLVPLVPLVLLALARPHPPPPVVPQASEGAELASQAAALRSRRFWTTAFPFGVIVMTQVGMMVHLVSLLLPPLRAEGAAIAMALVAACAVAGRVALGMVADRIDLRRAGAAGTGLQMAGLGLMLALPAQPWALYLGCVMFGLWVGNNITLPPLLFQRDFSRASFGLVVGLYSALAQLGYAVVPGVFGLVHDASGGYGAVLALAIALQGTGALVLLARAGKG
jgi:predicted MFS family arabinose efflux permease